MVGGMGEGVSEGWARRVRWDGGWPPQEGELLAHPGDTTSMWPGVSASHRSVRSRPKFISGGFSLGQGYAWMPLARRLDLDRVLHCMRSCPEFFEDVRPTGEGAPACGRAGGAALWSADSCQGKA
jgi:hypothetical protein